MQVTCHLSRRWHQQFCHSPSFESHQKCLQILIPKRSYRTNRGTAIKQQRPPEHNADRYTNDLSDIDSLAPAKAFAPRFENRSIREFEQYGSDTSTRKPIDPSKFLRDQAELVWKQLQDVEAQLQEVRKGPFDANSPLLRDLPVDKREELLKLLSSEMTDGNEEEDMLDLAELDRMLEADDVEEELENELQVTIRIPKAQQAFVTKFNKALSEAQQQMDDSNKALRMWKWYLRCQQRVPAFSSIIPDRVWTFLWESQRMLGSRPRHMIMLGQDMIAADQHLEAGQQVDMIQALHSENDTASALRMWDQSRVLEQNASDKIKTKYASIGIQLYAAVGRTDKAQRVALSAIQKGASPEILVHAIQGWIESKDPRALTKVWVLYLKLRALLGDSMQPDLYEKISDALLSGNHSQMALTIFKDMVARIQGDGKNTLEAYRAAIGSIPFDAEPEDVEQAINEMSLNILLALPHKYRNKFFFASWIKKLIGQGRVESAAMVVDLMYERRIKPDALHLNGMIGAWLRERRALNRGKALQLAEEMIQARIVQANDQMTTIDDVLTNGILRKYLSSSGLSRQNEISLNRPVPAANQETFLLLFNHYSQEGQWENYEQLSRTMTEFARLKPNTLILNKSLSLDLDAGAFQRFWASFHANKKQSQCNIETFRLGWQAVSAQKATVGGRHVEESLSARQLFGDMVDWYQSLPSAHKRSARGDLNAAVYSTIVRTFAKQSDLVGTLCAIQGLNTLFKASPDDLSIQLMLTLAAQRLPNLGTARSPHARRQRRIREDQTLLKGITELVEQIELKHKFYLVNNDLATTTEVDDPSSDAAKRIRVDVITELLLVVAKKSEKPDSNTSKSLIDVAKVMHVDLSQLDVAKILGGQDGAQRS